MTQTIKQLVDEHAALEAKTLAWYVENVKPKLDACTTMDEANALYGELVYDACDDEKQIRSLPSMIQMQFFWAHDRIRQLAKQGKVD